jgi:hypothetical protein
MPGTTVLGMTVPGTIVPGATVLGATEPITTVPGTHGALLHNFQLYY